MTKLVTASLYFHPAAIVLSPSYPILKTSPRFRRDSIFELKVPQGLLKPGHRSLKTRHFEQLLINFLPIFFGYFRFPQQLENCPRSAYSFQEAN